MAKKRTYLAWNLRFAKCLETQNGPVCGRSGLTDLKVQSRSRLLRIRVAGFSSSLQVEFSRLGEVLHINAILNLRRNDVPVVRAVPKVPRPFPSKRLVQETESTATVGFFPLVESRFLHNVRTVLFERGLDCQVPNGPQA